MLTSQFLAILNHCAAVGTSSAFGCFGGGKKALADSKKSAQLFRYTFNVVVNMSRSTNRLAVCLLVLSDGWSVCLSDSLSAGLCISQFMCLCICIFPGKLCIFSLYSILPLLARRLYTQLSAHLSHSAAPCPPPPAFIEIAFNFLSFL